MVYELPKDGMILVGLMLVKNEDWVLGCSLRAALDWCDKVVVTLDHCTDKSLDIVLDVQKELGKDRVIYEVRGGGVGFWDEMNVRHENFVLGRKYGGTHFAIVDADEILTANCLPHMRPWHKALAPGQILDLPMVPNWEGLDKMRDDDSVWTRARLTVGFRDKNDLHWYIPEGGYHHHNRPPKGALPNRMWPIEKYQGGVFHLQFANKRRLLAKHVLYRMVDHLRWPNRENVEQLNAKYDQALSAPGKLTEFPPEWWGDFRRDLIKLDGVPWQEAEIVRLLKERGLEAFRGLDLKGFST